MDSQLLDMYMYGEESRPDDFKTFHTQLIEGALGIRRTFSLVDKITNTKFLNSLKVFEIGMVWQ